jgi:exodeoxyribonuclease VII large subunit
MEEAGIGELRRAFEQLRDRLQAAGLFDQDKKRSLPALPQHLAIITSPTGAAIRDVLSVIKRRFPAMRSTIIPSQVQGEQAADQVVAALELANTYSILPFDAILLTRGGGSLEDLWTFNTEPVALAIANSQIPVISAVGHESDVTIADFVADVRAATPSAAAEILAPDQTEWMQTLDHLGQRLKLMQTQLLSQRREALNALSRRLRNPSQILVQLTNRLQSLEQRLTVNASRALTDPDLSQTESRLRLAVGHRLRQEQQALDRIKDQMPAAVHKRLERDSARLRLLAGKLDALSPLAVLERGYALARGPSGDIVKSVEAINIDDQISIELKDGTAEAQILKVNKNAT